MATDLTISGRVQGVSYRWETQRQAERLGVTGWVRNEPDGSVRAHLEGDPDAVGRLVDWCRQGPPGAHVDRVTVGESDDTDAPDFQIRF